MIQTSTIHNVSKQVGISSKTIRYYESIGVIKLPERADNGYRLYSKKDIQRLHLVKRAKDLGLSIEEIRSIVSECIDKGCESARKHVSTMVPSYIEKIDKRLNELNNLRDDFVVLEKQYKDKTTWEHSTDNCCDIIPLERQL